MIQLTEYTKRIEETIEAYHDMKITGTVEFKVDGVVKISKRKHVFGKRYTPNWI